MTFTDEIREEADRMWEAILDHPMVRELGQGTLDEAPFRYWVRQDYVYLIEYSRLFALGASKASTLDHMGNVRRPPRIDRHRRDGPPSLVR